MRFGLRELIFLIVLLSVPIASFVFVFKPRNEEIRQATKEIEIKEDKLERLQQVSGRIDDIGVAIDEWQIALASLESKLPSEQGIERILEQVWNLTADNDLEILSTKADPAVPASSYMELPLKIEMVGDFDGFYQFLLELEQLDRITRIHELNLVRAGQNRQRGVRPTDDELPEGSMEADFTLSIYYESTGKGSSVASAH